MMEQIANLEWWKVLIIVAVLLGIRFALAKQQNKTAKSVAETAESLAVAMALVFFLIRPFIVQAFFIPSPSMHPTLLENDHILVNKFIYRVQQPKRGDVVVFKAPPNASADGIERDFIKRVIGIPGDTVRITPGYVLVGNDQLNHQALRALLEGAAKIEFRDGRVYEDGEAVSNRELAELARTPFASVEVGPDSVTIGMMELSTDELRTVLAERHSVKLITGSVYRDGKKVPNAEVAKLSDKPGAKVVVITGLVYLNGKPLIEKFTAEDPDAVYPGGERNIVDPAWVVLNKKHEQMVKIPKGKLLVMGDNRNNSYDARFWGLLDRPRILGKAMVMFWPLNRIRIVR